MVTPSLTPAENIRSWQEHEFWEDLERERRRRQRRWIAASCALFMVLISVPVWWDRAPKWGALRLTRELAGVMNLVKRQAAIDGKAHRLRVDSGLRLIHETASNCASKDWQGLDAITLGRPGDEARWELLTSSSAVERGVPGILDRFCYDPINGYSVDKALTVEEYAGWGIAPLQDRQANRLDRLAVVFVRGPGADLQFE